jgi:hypothetical protein
MFTPPKGKSPWEAMTSGSTGGWASGLGPSQPYNIHDPSGNDWAGPLVTGIMGALGGPFGPLISGGMGAMGSMGGGTGFQGTDAGWSNLWKTPLGALGGYGAGTLGSGVGSAIQGGITGASGGLSGITSGIGQGFGQGTARFLGTPIIPGMGSTSGGAIGNNIMGMFNPSQQGYQATLAGTKLGASMGPGIGNAAGSAAASGAQGFGSGILPQLAKRTGSGTNIANRQTVTPPNYQASQVPINAGQEWLNKQGNITASGKFLGGALGDNPLMTAAGLGVSALGALQGRGEGAQEWPRSDYWNEYTNRLLGGSPLKTAATTNMLGLMERPAPGFNPVSDEMYSAAVRKNKEMEVEAEKNLRTEYKGVRPGADVESDSGFRQDLLKMRDKFAKERAAINTELAFNREKEYNTRTDDFYNQKANYLTNVLKLQQDEISQYAQWAQLDQNILESQFGLSAGEAANFKKLFGDIGAQMMNVGTGQNWQSYYDKALQMGAGR